MDKSDRSMSKTPAVTTLESVLKRLSTGADPWGSTLSSSVTRRQKLSTVDELLAYDWNNKFTDAVVKVNVELSLKHARKLVESHSVKY